MVLAAPSGMQMRETYLPVTVSSSDMNPRVISSAHAELRKRVRFTFAYRRVRLMNDDEFEMEENECNRLPDLTFSRASNSAFFRFLLSNWVEGGRATARKETNQRFKLTPKQRRSRLKSR
jgi:hypothetical protein